MLVSGREGGTSDYDCLLTEVELEGLQERSSC